MPSGASTGAHEAVELRDGDKARYGGKGVLKAVESVNRDIFEALSGLDAEDQGKIDEIMIDLDGTPNKAKLGANAILGVSLAVAKAAADASALPLYRYLGGVRRACSAGADDEHHQRRRACRQSDRFSGIHDPAGRRAFAKEAVRWGSEVFHALKSALKKAGHNTNVGDEGGFAPNLPSAEAALDFSCRRSKAPASSRARHRAGLDRASTEFFKDGAYVYSGEGVTRSPEEQAHYLAKLAAAYPIVYHRGRHVGGRLGGLEGC